MTIEIDIDDPLVMDANYQFDEVDRRKIDDQILLLQSEAAEIVAEALEFPEPLVNGDMFYYSAGTLQRVPIGTVGQVWSVLAGPTLGWADNVGGGAALDIDTLAFNLALRGSYASIPWVGFATAGTSNLYRLTTDQCGTAPAVGAASNGYDAASFDGVVSGGGVATAAAADIHWSDIASASAYYGFAVIKVRSAAAPTAAIYDNAQLVADNGGNIGVAISSSGVAAYHFDTGGGAGFKTTGWKSMTLNAYHLVEWWYDGTQIHIAVDRVEGTPVTATSADVLGAIKVRIGLNYNSTKFVDALLEEVRVAPTNLSANSADVKTYANTRYGLAL